MNRQPRLPDWLWHNPTKEFLSHPWVVESMNWLNRRIPPKWSLPVALTALLFLIVHLDGMRPDAFPDIVAVRCAGQILNSGGNPYGSPSTVCGPHVLDFFYLPMVARFSSLTVEWLGVPGWMAAFQLLYAASLATLLIVAYHTFSRKCRSAAALVAAAATFIVMGGGVGITGFRSGNVAVFFWAAISFAVLELRSMYVATVVIVAAACIKVHLIYLLVVPALMGKTVRLPILGGCVVALVYLLERLFDSDLFANYVQALRRLSHSPGYAGASSMQLGVWSADLTAIPALRSIVVLVVVSALLWRSRYLVHLFLNDVQYNDDVQRRMLALLLLGLTVLSPRMTHYDLLMLLPLLPALGLMPSPKAACVIGCFIIPWLFRLALFATRFDPLKSWLYLHQHLEYSGLWEFYLFGTCCAVTGYAWLALGRRSIDEVVAS